MGVCIVLTYLDSDRLGSDLGGCLRGNYFKSTMCAGGFVGDRRITRTKLGLASSSCRCIDGSCLSVAVAA